MTHSLHETMPDAMAGDQVRATFRPTITDTLRPEVLPYIGSTDLWSCGWPIDLEDGYPAYCGMNAWLAPIGLAGSGLGWVPACDLVPADV